MTGRKENVWLDIGVPWEDYRKPGAGQLHLPYENPRCKWINGVHHLQESKIPTRKELCITSLSLKQLSTGCQIPVLVCVVLFIEY